MSNSIWKMPDQKPEPNKTIVAKIAQTGFCVDYKTIKGMETLPNFEKWCYLDDLIAQADKAERLQKAVDLALDMLLEISDGYDIMAADSETIKRLFYTIQDNAKNARDEIKQLIKETTNDK